MSASLLQIDIKEETTYSSSTEDLNRKGTNETIFKRIPVGAEATTVLVGSVDFLEQPTIAFVRLAEGALMPSITEVIKSSVVPLQLKEAFKILCLILF